MCNRDITVMISLVVSKQSSHRGRPSSNPRRNPIFSLLLPRDWRFKGNGEGREHEVACRWRRLELEEWDYWGKKDYILLKVDYIYFPCCYYFFNIFFNYILWCECFIYADRLCVTSTCSVFKSVMWWWPPLVVVVQMVGEPSRVPPTGYPVELRGSWWPFGQKQSKTQWIALS